MRKNQLGVSLGGLMVGAVILIVLAMIGLKLIPSYIEFFAIKKAVTAIGAGSAQRRQRSRRSARSFDSRATIDAIDTRQGLGPGDHQGRRPAWSFRSPTARKSRWSSNIGVYIDFSATSKE